MRQRRRFCRHEFAHRRAGAHHPPDVQTFPAGGLHSLMQRALCVDVAWAFIGTEGEGECLDTEVERTACSPIATPFAWWRAKRRGVRSRSVSRVPPLVFPPIALTKRARVAWLLLLLAAAAVALETALEDVAHVSRGSVRALPDACAWSARLSSSSTAPITATPNKYPVPCDTVWGAARPRSRLVPGTAERLARSGRTGRAAARLGATRAQLSVVLGLRLP